MQHQVTAGMVSAGVGGMDEEVEPKGLVESNMKTLHEPLHVT